MVTMDLGSVAVQVYNAVLDIPTALSGTVLRDIADRQRLYMERFTGQTIGSKGIAERFQQPLIDLTCAAVLSSMELQGTDVSKVRLGDFSEEKGTNSNTSVARQFFER